MGDGKNFFGKAPESAEPEDKVDGAGGPNLTPAFAKHDGQDESVQVTDSHIIEEAEKGAEASSAPARDVDALRAARLAPDVSDGEDTVQYASPSISRLKIGKFQFENGRLSVTQEDSEKLDALLEKSSPRTKQTVMKIDREGGNAVARRFLEQNKGHMTRGGDTTANVAPAPKPGEQKHDA